MSCMNAVYFSLWWKKKKKAAVEIRVLLLSALHGVLLDLSGRNLN